MSSDYCHFNENNESLTFHINLFGYDLSLKQKPSAHNLGHGAVVWDAAVIFAKYVEKNMKEFDYSKLKDKHILELGSGCGLAGLSLLIRGASVTFTDMSKVTESLTERNVQNIYTQIKLENNSSDLDNISLHPPKVVPFDWTDRESSRSLLLPTYDMILLTDCVFSMDLVDDLVQCILMYANPKTTIIVCHEIRDEITNTAFISKLSEHSKIKNIAKSKLHPDYSNEFVELFTAKLLREK